MLAHRVKQAQWVLRVTEAVEDNEESLALREMPDLQGLKVTLVIRETKVFRVPRAVPVL